MKNNQYNENRYNRYLQWYRFTFGLQQMTAHPLINALWILFAVGVVFLVWGKKQFVSGLNASFIIVPIFQWCMTAMVIIFPIICTIGSCQFLGYMFAKKDEADMYLVFGNKRDIKNQPPILIYKKKDRKTGVTKREFYTSIPLECWEAKKEALCDIMNLRIVKGFYYGGRNNDNGNKIVFESTKGKKKIEREELYDEYF